MSEEKIGLTGQFDRRQPGNYLQPCPMHSIVAYDFSLVLNPPLPLVCSILKITFLSRLMQERSRLGNKSHPAGNQQAQASHRSEGVLDPGIF